MRGAATSWRGDAERVIDIEIDIGTVPVHPSEQNLPKSSRQLRRDVPPDEVGAEQGPDGDQPADLVPSLWLHHLGGAPNLEPDEAGAAGRRGAGR